MQETKVEQKLAKPVSRKTGPSYLVVFIVLAVLTGLEIVVSQLPIPRAPILIPMAFIKVALVALFYMHLRTDRRLFAMIFVIGVLVGITLILTFAVLFSTQTGGV